MNKKVLIASGVLSLALLFAGCSENINSEETSSNTPPATVLTPSPEKKEAVAPEPVEATEEEKKKISFIDNEEYFGIVPESVHVPEEILAKHPNANKIVRHLLAYQYKHANRGLLQESEYSFDAVEDFPEAHAFAEGLNGVAAEEVVNQFADFKSGKLSDDQDAYDHTMLWLLGLYPIASPDGYVDGGETFYAKNGWNQKISDVKFLQETDIPDYVQHRINDRSVVVEFNKHYRVPIDNPEKNMDLSSVVRVQVVENDKGIWEIHNFWSELYYYDLVDKLEELENNE